MKKMPLTQGQFAKVSNKDFKWLSQWKWFAQWDPRTHSYYAVRDSYPPNGKRRRIFMHRIILELKYGDKLQVDHLNHDTLDNRRKNIRTVSSAQNQHNQRHSKGYVWKKKLNKYIAQIQINGFMRHLGVYDTKEEARAIYLFTTMIYDPSTPIELLIQEGNFNKKETIKMIQLILGHLKKEMSTWK